MTQVADGCAPGFFGLYPAIVTDLVDTDDLGRIEVRFPWLGTSGDRDARAWATLCTPYANADQGIQILPDVESQVVVGFEAGNLRRPYIVGCTWNGTTPLPHDPDSENNVRQWRTRSGSVLRFDDAPGSESIEVRTESGHVVELDNTTSTITIEHAGGCVIRLTASAIEIRANSSVDITAPTLNVNSSMSTFSGTVKCLVLQTPSVIASSYTPGAGNVW